MGSIAALKERHCCPGQNSGMKKLIVLLLWLGYEDVLVKI
jgi:hypothetical protein